MQPYIVRRIKSEVLTELPPKTEQSIIIEPSSEETAFYEVVRKKALEQFQAGDNDVFLLSLKAGGSGLN